MLTDSTNNERNEKPSSGPDHLENVHQCGQSKQNNEDDRCNPRRVVVVQDVCGVGHDFDSLYGAKWSEAEQLLNKD